MQDVPCLSQVFAKTVADHFLIERTALMPADLGFVFGNPFRCSELAALAADYYRAGYFPALMVTGGVYNNRGVREARDIRSHLVQDYNIPRQAVLIEDTSTNTQENIENAQGVLDREFGLESIRSVIGFGQMYASRRYLMTLRRRWPEVLAMHVSLNTFNVAPEQWHLDSHMRVKVLSELRKYSAYLRKGWTEPVDVDQINAEVIHNRNLSTRAASDREGRPGP